MEAPRSNSNSAGLVWVAVTYIDGKGRVQPVANKEVGFRWLVERLAPDWPAYAAAHPEVPAEKPETAEKALTSMFGPPGRSPEVIFADEVFFGDGNNGARVMYMHVLDDQS